MNPHPEAHEPEPAPCSPQSVTWRDHYAGVFAVATIGERRVAGISGPWSGKFALTWWDRPLPQRQLELFDSLEEARRAVEAWASRIQHGAPVAVAVAAPAALQPKSPAAAPSGLLGRVVALFGHPRAHRAGDSIERLRRSYVERDAELAEVHFAACDEAAARS
ncbi:MAG: hypothetical protein J0H15_03150 [Xanthomonadales bacterium]|nr:hypothetical protein [Xanthomonadales bacterium]